MKKVKTTYFLAIKASDGNCIISFTDEANLMNFMMDVEDHVLGMALAVTYTGWLLP